MKKTEYKAIAEVPIHKIEEDSLGIGAYAKSLAAYIKNCVTPITIAVQGEWGCGKTSMLNMIHEELENYALQQEHYLCISFNTWQYSQFEMAETLSVTFLTHFLKKLQEELGENEEVEAVLDTVKRVAAGFVKKAALITAGKIGGDDFKDIAQGAIDEITTDNREQADYIKELREQIESCIKVATTEKNFKRIVVFLDDLDRLNPIRAVELIEIIKIFLDCSNCVFVLAVDTSVIKQGIVQKYGLSEEKSQAFFDKLIQLPFSMPISHYDYGHFIESVFSDENGNYKKEFYDKLTRADQEKCIRLLRLASGKNPRTAKRIMNAFVLRDMVNHCSSDKTAEEKVFAGKVTLALCCIQMKLPIDYQLIVEKAGSFFNFQKWLRTDDILEIKDEWIRYRWGYSEEDVEKYKREKETCIPLMVCFKEWCIEYLAYHKENPEQLKHLLCALSANDSEEEESPGVAITAKKILNNLNRILSEMRRKIVLDYMDTNKADEEYELWYEEAREVFSQDKKYTRRFSYERMLEEITKLSQELCVKGIPEEEILCILDFYDNLDSISFQTAFGRDVIDVFADELAYDIGQGYSVIKKCELNIENIMKIHTCIELAKNEKEKMNLLLKCLQSEQLSTQTLRTGLDLLEKEEQEVLADVYYELRERVQYFVTKCRILSRKKGSIKIDSRPIHSLFEEASMVENTKYEYQLMKKWKKLLEKVPSDEKEKRREEEYCTLKKKYEEAFWKKEVQERAEICEKILKPLLDGVEDTGLKQNYTWILEEGTRVLSEEERLQWYFSVVQIIALCKIQSHEKELQYNELKLKHNSQRRIFKAVEILEKESWVLENSFRLSEEAVSELKLAHDNTDGWQYDELPEDFTKMALNEIRALLEKGEKDAYGMKTAYQLGKIIGWYFDEDAYCQDILHASFKKSYQNDNGTSYMFMDRCCFEKRESAYLWKYYQVYKTVINQLRIFHEDLKGLITDSIRDKSVMNICEKRFCFEHIEHDYDTLQKLAWEYAHVWRGFDKLQSTSEEEAVTELQVYFEPDSIAFGHALEFESILYCAGKLENWMENYYLKLGEMIYGKIPDLLEFIEKGKEPEEMQFSEGGRKQKIFREKQRKVFSMLETWAAGK